MSNDSIRLFATAFAKQAFSDKLAYEYLAKNKDLPACHYLHYLQMCLEKTAKAHSLYKNASFTTLEGIYTHKYIAKVLPALYREYNIRKGRKEKSIENEIKKVRHICQELDYLNPDIKDNARYDNCEYPWYYDGNLRNMCIPSEHVYPVVDDLESSLGIRFIKVIFAIIGDYLE